MELKAYQKLVIKDISTYLDHVETHDRYDSAYTSFWEEKGYVVDDLSPGKALPSYKNTIKNCPHICVKVPTAWGKTYIACNALKPIFDHFPLLTSQVVVRLVPSNSILQQTIKNLSNPAHPYRQRISSHFNGRVDVFTKDQLLSGSWFNNTSIKEQLTICVLSFDTFRSRRKEDRKIYQENSNLANFHDIVKKDRAIEKADETSLMHVLHHLEPVIVVDESHNATSDLSIEMLTNLNPSFILDLTATPRENSNIISYVSAMELKKENMVKLPVLVYNQKSKKDVINNALALQRNLEEQAKASEANWWEYIRPIVLFQAEPKNAKDTETFEKIETMLVKAWIPASHIAIKTANKDTLKSHDLMSKECEIRYIITVNALKEWRDCPFAYILATLANRSSTIDVTQILWRVLRQPYVKQHADPFLNVSYVFCSTAKFLDTLDSVVQWLNNSWFTSKQWTRHEDSADEDLWGNDFVQGFDPPTTPWEFFTQEENKNTTEEEHLTEDDIIISGTSSPSLDDITSAASSQIEKFNQEFEGNNEELSGFFVPAPELGNMKNSFSIKEIFQDDREKVILPQFYQYVKPSGLFVDEDSENGKVESLLLRKALNGWFNLLQQDTNINFSEIDSQMYQVDIQETWKDEYHAKFSKSKKWVQQQFMNYLSNIPESEHISAMTKVVMKKVLYLDSIAQQDLKIYIERVLQWVHTDILQDMKENIDAYGNKIKIKIVNLLSEWRTQQFQNWLDTNKVFLSWNLQLPKSISYAKSESSIIKSFYTEEGTLNWFEKWVIVKIAELESVKRRHKFYDNKWFHINWPLNHYPDFIVYTQKWNIVIVETKGDHLDNSDSKIKLKLGQTRANKAWQHYHYFMTFDNNPIDWAQRVSDLLDIIREL